MFGMINPPSVYNAATSVSQSMSSMVSNSSDLASMMAYTNTLTNTADALVRLITRAYVTARSRRCAGVACAVLSQVGSRITYAATVNDSATAEGVRISCSKRAGK